MKWSIILLIFSFPNLLPNSLRNWLECSLQKNPEFESSWGFYHNFLYIFKSNTMYMYCKIWIFLTSESILIDIMYFYPSTDVPYHLINKCIHIKYHYKSWTCIWSTYSSVYLNVLFVTWLLCYFNDFVLNYNDFIVMNTWQSKT